MVGQCPRPVIAQVDRDLATLGRRRVAVLGQHLPLEFENLRLVEFEDDRAGGPRQPVGPRVQPGRQKDDLTDTGRRRLVEVGVEVLCACTLETHEEIAELGPQPRVGRTVVLDAVQHVGPGAADGAAEQLGIRVNGKGFGLLPFQSPCRGYEQGRRAHARRDVPGVVVSAHWREGTPGYLTAG